MNTDVLQSIFTTLEVRVLHGDRTQCRGLWGRKPEHPHIDPFNRLYWVAGGYGIVEIEERIVELVPGNLYVFPAHQRLLHACPNGDLDLYWTHFIANVFSGFNLFTLLGCDYEAAVEDYAWTQTLWDRLHTRSFPRTALELLSTDGLLRQLLTVFLAKYECEMLAERLHGLAQFREVLTFIERHYHSHITLQELAHIAHLHPTYFSNRFTALIGEPPLRYVGRRRIEHAKHLLLQGNNPLRDIAMQTGFCDEYHFSRMFKRCVGQTPGQYRHQHSLGIP